MAILHTSVSHAHMLSQNIRRKCVYILYRDLLLHNYETTLWMTFKQKLVRLRHPATWFLLAVLA